MREEAIPAEMHDRLVERIVDARPPGRPVIVGIGGMAGSGKTMLARNLARLLENRGEPVCHVGIDEFHHPKAHRYRRGADSPEGYYRDSFDLHAFAEGALRPVFEAASFPVRFQVRHLDLARDVEDRRFATLPADGVLLAEGVFLFRPELVRFLHLRIHVHADVDVVMERVRRRDLAVLGSLAAIERRYREKYLPGERLYEDEVRPRDLADIVLDNTDPANPVLS